LYRLKEEWIAPDKNMALFGRNDDRWVYQQELIGQYFMKATGLKKGAKVLDIGCAEGLVCKYLENQGISAYGVEPCIPMANYARSILGLKNISCCDYTSETYAAELFDGIVTHHVLEHIVAIPDFFNAVQKQIKSGGYLLLQTPCLDHLHLAKAYQRILSGGHLYAFSESFLRNMLLDRHFEILDCKKTPLDLSELDPAERAAWNTTVWADDPGGISFLAQKNGHL
jgi:2-polyprenyl-3-methyl-5-hydroxy-6-metoxy-1,4-benzoquinol methylase